jgi:hypothetical protein
MLTTHFFRLAFLFSSTLILISPLAAQTTYAKYDCVTRGAEYHAVKSQIESNKQEIRLLEEQKKKYSVMNSEGSHERSRIQALISAKQNENFRLQQKAFLLMDANKVENVDDYNKNLQKARPQVKSNN